MSNPTATAKPIQLAIGPMQHPSGFCQPGNSPESHARCRGAFRNGSNAKVRVLTCPCQDCKHDENLVCLDCGTPGSALEIHPETRVCLNHTECQAQRQAKIDHDPTIRLIRQSQATASERREAQGLPATTRRVRTPSPDRPTSGTCHCCGEATKGGLFVAGHDARLKGMLKKAAATDAWAWAEATARAVTKSEAWRPKGDSPEGAEILARLGATDTINHAVQRRLNPEG